MGINYSVPERTKITVGIWPGITESDIELRFNFMFLDDRLHDKHWNALHSAIKPYGYTLGELTKHNQAIVYISGDHIKTVKARFDSAKGINLVWQNYNAILHGRQ